MILIENKLKNAANIINAKLDEILPNNKSDELFCAIRYSSIPGGKCIRGFITLEIFQAFGVPQTDAILAACIIELIHTFSLIHDDLPVLDNADTRRGKASCHKAFCESTAILAGDAILVIAYQLIGSHFPCATKFVSDHILEMINGQACEISGHGLISSTEINKLKTGAIFALSCSFGAFLCGNNAKEIYSLREFGYNFGLLFQLIDDIQDGDIKYIDHKSNIQNLLDLLYKTLEIEIFKQIKGVFVELISYISSLVL